ncbi:MAG: hypothetical protein MR021_07670 [Clostridiales bacterium]|nr:hypothetical protein [Clostridiales bacterium]
MPWKNACGRVRRKNYPSSGGLRRAAGYALIVLGTVLLLLCIPLRAWLALLGAAMIAAGIVLIV